MPGTNGWKSGSDPTLKALRGVAVVTLIGLLVWWVILDARQDVLVGALIVGAILAALFGDIAIALPFLRAERRDDQRQQDNDEKRGPILPGPAILQFHSASVSHHVSTSFECS